MKESSTDKASHIDRIRSWARGHAYGGSTQSTASNSTPVLPLNNPIAPNSHHHSEKGRNASTGNLTGHNQGLPNGSADHNLRKPGPNNEDVGKSSSPASEMEGTGALVDDEGVKKKPNLFIETCLEFKKVLLHSWINVFLVCVPIGIAIANIPNKNAGATFGVNAVAIIPLAALLSHATESVARKMGDTIGALLNVTFGNAVELIIL